MTETRIFGNKPARAAALLIIFCALSANAGNTYLNLKTDLAPGPHAVGFKVIHTYDHARSYAIKYDEQGKQLNTPNPRPMQISIWYPAQKAGTPIKFKEYIYLESFKDRMEPLTEAEHAMVEMGFINQRLFPRLGTPDKEYLAHLLEAETTATRDADVKQGKFPLLLFVNREYRGVATNTVLMEYLASHGYIVATTPSKDETKSYQAGMSDEKLVQSNLEDIRFVKGQLIDFPSLDHNRVGAIGYFVGSLTTPLLAASDQNVSAIVNIQSLLNVKFGQELLEKFSGFNPQNLRVPILDFHLPFDPASKDEPKFYQATVYGDSYKMDVNAKFDGLAFSSGFNTAWIKSTDKRSDEEKAGLDRAYAAMTVYTRHFFDGYLKEESKSLTFIRDSNNKLASGAFKPSFRKALAAPPTEQQFVGMIRSKGMKAAKAHYQTLVKQNPSLVVILTSGTLNGVGYGLMDQEKLDEALAVFVFNVEIFPNDPNILDSLAETYKARGDDKLAIKTYKKVLDMEPGDSLRENAVRMLKELGVG